MEKKLTAKCTICSLEYTLRYIGHHIQKCHNISPETYYIEYLKNIQPKCPICETKPKFKSIPEGYRTYCSAKCLELAWKTDNNLKERVKIANKKTNMEKYGVENVFQTDWCKEKTKQTNLKKFGVEHPMKSIIVQNKGKKTNMERYGVENPFQSKDIIQNKILPKKDYIKQNIKTKQTNLKKYGVENYFQTETGKEKIRYYKKQDMIHNIFHGDRLKNKVTPLFKKEDYTIVDKLYKWKCNICNNEFDDNLDDGKIPQCNVCFPHIVNSKYEYIIIDYLKSLDNSIEITKGNRKILNGLELDIYIPSKKIAIEFNGLYYHCEIAGNKNKNYHLNKSNKCKIQGIQLIHIFEDEWRIKKHIIKNKLKHMLGLNNENKIYARKCNIKEISPEICKLFLEENHLQGNDNSLIKLGLYYNDNLISIMTFNNLIKNKYQLFRFCNKLNINVIGAASKLLAHFIKNYNPSNIITYADIRWSNGNLYEKIGFKLISNSKPNYYYVKNHYCRYDEYEINKYNLKENLEFYNPNLTIWQNLKINNWDKTWDCGCYIYEMIIN